MSATYRLQLRKGFGFAEAAAVVPYLEALGVSHAYASPILAARPGSTHGYDVTDPTRLNPELGGEDGFAALSEQLRERGMGLLVDIVPNHMAASPDNLWWWDVLMRGRESKYAEWFDIDWERAGGKVVLPVLGHPLEEVLTRGEILLQNGAGGAGLRYFDHRFPVSGPADAPVGQVLSRQHYRLVYWKDGPRLINYRRFFDVSELVAVNAGREDVFTAQHEKVLRELHAGRIAALRVDHIDGLRDPRAYLDRLAAAIRNTQTTSEPIFVEKILEEHEHLPESWPVHGTTGYDALNQLARLFVDPDGFEILLEDAREEFGLAESFEAECATAKRFALETMFQGDFDAVAGLMAQATGPHPRLKEVLAALTVAMPVYRTYLSAGEPAEADIRVLREAARAASGSSPDLRPALDALVASIIRHRESEAVQRWEQLTGPLMAKGVEDTAMYRWIALTSMNEVGGRPVPEREPIARFHQENARAATRTPGRLVATSTHDTKRADDVRARISVLSEIPDLWLAAVERWSGLSSPKLAHLRAGPAPTPRDEMLLYQTLIGAWPLSGEPDAGFIDRMQAYMIKAAREAKLRTSWTDPDREYEKALESVVAATLTDPRLTHDIGGFQQITARLGALNSLSQLVLKATMPGTPDFYQGTELWDLSLVDPDNRRPVDFDRRQRELNELRARWEQDPVATLDTCLRSWRDGRVKLLLTWRLLTLRREHPALFESADYVPLRAEGDHADRVVAFARRGGARWMIVAGARLMHALEPTDLPLALERVGWERTTLVLPENAPATWREAFTGRRPRPSRSRMDLADILSPLPGAVLLST